MKARTPFETFEALDLRVGRIESVEVGETRKPTYRLRIDLGPEFGTVCSVGQFTHIDAEELIGMRVVVVANLPARKMGPETSDVLVLGAPDSDGRARPLVPQGSEEVSCGAAIF